MSSAIVFGATGGIGRALVDTLANSGIYETIYAASRSPVLTSYSRFHPLRVDIMSEGSLKAAARSIETDLDLVIVATGVLHNAAYGISPEKTYRALDPHAMAETFAINTIGPALVAKHFLPKLPRDRRSVFAALSARIGSIADNRLGGWHSYRASKAALNMLIANFAIEARRTHGHAIVAALHPGTVATDLSAPFRRSDLSSAIASPEKAASDLMRVVDGLTLHDTGGFFAWDGSRIPW